MNTAFVTQGIAFALAGALVVTAMRAGPGTVAFLGLAWVYGFGCVVVGVFPSGGPGTSVHAAGAAAAIVAGNLAILTAGSVLLRRRRCRALGITGVPLGAAGLVCGGVLLGAGALDTDLFFGDGAWERGAVDSIIVWQLLAGVSVWIRPSRCATDPQLDSPDRL